MGKMLFLCQRKKGDDCMKLVNIYLLYFILCLLVISSCYRENSPHSEWNGVFISQSGDRYYIDSKSIAKGIDGGSINYFEMRVYPSFGSELFKEIEKIDLVKLAEMKKSDYLYKNIQADIDCQKDTIKLKHTDYMAVPEENLNSDIHEPEKWQEIDTDPMKAIREAVCR
jgi:hypothetical protein